MENWQQYTGHYAKDEYYIKTKKGEIFGPCWPNAGMFHPIDGSGIIIDGMDVLEVSRTNKFNIKDESILVFTEKLMEPYFQALEKCRGVPQMEKHHPEGDVFDHSLQVLQWAFRESIDTDLIFAAMLHDVGKVVAFKGHGEKAIEMLGDHLSAKTRWLIEQHMRIWDMVLGEMRRLMKVKHLIEHPFLPDLILLARWDKMGRNPKRTVYYDKGDIIERLNMCVEKSFSVNKEE